MYICYIIIIMYMYLSYIEKLNFDNVQKLHLFIDSPKISWHYARK